MFHDDAPLRDHVLEGPLDLLVCVRDQLHLFHVDLLEQVVDPDSLLQELDLGGQIRVLVVKFLVSCNTLSILLCKLLFFDFEHLVLSVKLALFDAQLNQVIAICVVFLELYVEFVVQIKELLLKLELLIKDILALGFFVTTLVHKICAGMLESIHVLFVFDADLAFFILLLLLYLPISDILSRNLVLEFHIMLVNDSLIFE